MVGHYAVANLETADTFSCLNNRSRHLMTEDTRRLVRACEDLLQVCSADSTGVDLYQHLTATDLRHGNCLDANIVDTAIDRGTHSGWHGIPLVKHFQFE
jgi:hypothetical protein